MSTYLDIAHTSSNSPKALKCDLQDQRTFPDHGFIRQALLGSDISAIVSQPLLQHLSLAISGLLLVMGEGGHFRHTLLGPKLVATPGQHAIKRVNKQAREHHY